MSMRTNLRKTGIVGKYARYNDVCEYVKNTKVSYHPINSIFYKDYKLHNWFVCQRLRFGFDLHSRKDL